jgi:hypothetical protein
LLAAAIQQRLVKNEDFMCAVVAMIYEVYKSMGLLYLFVLASFKLWINQIISRNLAVTTTSSAT